MAIGRAGSVGLHFDLINVVIYEERLGVYITFIAEHATMLLHAGPKVLE